MHESSLMKDLINQITVLAVNMNAREVTRVNLCLGALSHLSSAHLREQFTAHVAGSIAEHAELYIQLSNDINDPLSDSLLVTGIEVETDDA